ncbi:MAG: zinc ribbon domain-containing protein [Steroidobacteraceae bacterium]|jgi:putative FmdB family regulatory protein
MPIYDYHCVQCGRTFELLVRSTTIAACPHCRSEQLQQQISAPVAPGKSRAIKAAGRARAARAGHTTNYRRSNGKIVD